MISVGCKTNNKENNSMMSVTFSQRILRALIGAGLISTVFVIGGSAQVQTQTDVTNGPATQVVKVRRGKVIYASGNEVVIRGDDGIVRDFPNVPESVRVTVDGQQLSVHDLQPGMTIEQTTITTTTPSVITTIKTVTGTVWKVLPPTSVILTLENGKNQEFRIPDNTKFTVGGQQTDAFSLREGMKVSATAVTEVPETVVEKEVIRTGQMPPPPMESIDAHLAFLVILVPSDSSTEPAAAQSTQPASAQSTAEPATAAPAEPAPAQLPKTGSSLPLIALIGGLFCSLALALKARRAFNS
jgi:hypothetical protein